MNDPTVPGTTLLDSVRAILQEAGAPAYRSEQVTQAIFGHARRTFSSMTELPLPLRQLLAERVGDDVLSLRPLAVTQSPQADKVLFQLPDGEAIETVYMRYRAGWTSLCVSSQAGCALRCSFCATGAIGLKRNLTADEITDQVLFFRMQDRRVDSISFMGMGEALANPAFFPAAQALTAEDRFGFSPRRLTVSTVGLIPAIRRLTKELPQVNVTFSLHSPFSAQRDELVPLNRRYPLDDVLGALDEHVAITGRKAYLAYLLLDGINDTLDHVRALVALLHRRGKLMHLYHVNLIRYHPAAGAPADYKSSTRGAIAMFTELLRAAGIRVTLRQSFGVEIEAACGQLHARYPSLPQASSRQGAHVSPTAGRGRM